MLHIACVAFSHTLAEELKTSAHNSDGLIRVRGEERRGEERRGEEKILGGAREERGAL
jgi:hypothetical protein